MSNTVLIAIIEGFGLLAVIVSVLYLAREVRQNNLIARGESEREMFDSFNEIMHRYSYAESIEQFGFVLDAPQVGVDRQQPVSGIPFRSVGPAKDTGWSTSLERFKKSIPRGVRVHD